MEQRGTGSVPVVAVVAVAEHGWEADLVAAS